MPASFVRPEVPAMEDGNAPEIFINGLERIEPAGGGVYRYVCYRDRVDACGHPYREIACYILAPIENLPEVTAKQLELMAKHQPTADEKVSAVRN